MAIFGQFTKRAQQVLMTAQECATREGQPYVGTLHFLYGLLDVGEAPESVTRHIQKEDVKQVLDQIDDEVSLHPGHGPVQMTPRARRVLDGSIIESRRLGQLYVGTEHMWLGILANPNVKKDLFAGIQRVKRYLNPSGGPRLYIFRSCVNLIREFKSYWWGDGDAPKKADDHALDELRYFLMTRPFNDKPEEKSEIARHKERLSRAAAKERRRGM